MKRKEDLLLEPGWEPPFIVATPPLEKTETSHLPGRYKEPLEIGRSEGIKPTFEYISFFKSVHTLKKGVGNCSDHGRSECNPYS